MKNNFRIQIRIKTLLFAIVLLFGFGVASAQTKTISGTITTEGDPLPGVSVTIQGQPIGTVTDFDGVYELETSVGDVLVFAYVGFKNSVVTVGEQTTIDVAMIEDVSELDEVIVVGYQTQKKREVSGAVSSVKSEVLERQAVGNFAEALQGQLAGVNVQAQSGAPGATVNIQIRGANSLRSSGTAGLDPNGGIVNPNNNALGPLYVIDGVPFTDNPNISPNEIETIDVLKDGASAAIYGARASGGVILITTKKAEEGKIRANISTYTSINKITSSVPTLNNREFIALNIEELGNSSVGSFASNGILARNPRALGNNTDFQDLITNDYAITKNYAFRLSGGSKNANFNLTLDHLDQDGVFINSDFKRTNFRLNTRVKKGKFSVQTNITLGRQDANREPWAILYDAITSAATTDGPNELGEGNLIVANGNEINRLGEILQKLQQTSTRARNNAGLSLRLGYEILPGFNARFNVNGNFASAKSVFFEPSFIFLNEETGAVAQGREADAIARLQETDTNSEDTQIEAILDYKKKINKHNFSVLGGVSRENRLFETTRTRVRSFETNDLPTISQANDREVIDVAGRDFDSVILSYFGTFGYDFAGKYLLRVNARRDGSSKFARGFRFGGQDRATGDFFLGASAAWAISRENFFKNFEPLSFISDLKFRASYGEVGNQNIDDFQFLPTIANNLNVPLGTGNNTTTGIGLNQNRVFNQELTWETAISKNLGVDLALFSNAFTLAAEYYEVDKSDLLFDVILPPTSGAGGTTVATNLGKLSNKGVELTAGYKDNSHKLKWGVNGTFTKNVNRVEQLSGSNSQIVGQQITPGNNRLPESPVNFARPGFQAGAFFLLQTDGIIRSQEELDEYQLLEGSIPDAAQIGDIKYVDADNDGSIDINSDRVFAGNNTPDFEVGFNTNFNYKNFDFNMSWFASFGSKIFNGPKALAYNRRNHRDLLFAFSDTNTASNIPRVRVNPVEENIYRSDFFIEDGDYIRLRNVQLGYSLPKKAIEKYNISKIRLYIAASNLLTITDYTGFDPEVGGDGLFSRGLDRGLTPITASGRLGLEIAF